ncbi:MAG: hypothetical protein ACD_69C00340G0002 [uncultured bacterium]|nr:MAG: hypothetical protein ACD_69C00340G0002 [uncultured bacterium]HBC72106.1 hypothetical protein [Coxiellaceae bacterium]
MFNLSCEYRALLRCNVQKCSAFGTKWYNYPIIVSEEVLVFKEPAADKLSVIWAKDKHYCGLVVDGDITDIVSEKYYEVMSLQKKCPIIEQAQKDATTSLQKIQNELQKEFKVLETKFQQHTHAVTIGEGGGHSHSPGSRSEHTHGTSVGKPQFGGV